MSGTSKLTKEQLIKIIERLEKNPKDRVGILADIGVTAIGAAGRVSARKSSRKCATLPDLRQGQ